MLKYSLFPLIWSPDHYNEIIKLQYEPAHGILVLNAYAQKPRLNDNAEVFRMAIGLHIGLSLHLHPYIIYTSSESSGESVLLHGYA